MSEPVWRQAATLTPGEYVAVCAGAETVDSAAGNKCVRWTFVVDGTELARTTVVRRVETGRTALALGLRLKPLRLADAVGKRCRVTVKQDGAFLSIDSVRPL